ncbi:MAG: dTDP-4-dehydrorhamnose 3,5-epimerase family protein [Anaerolineae bacterium]
MKILEVKTLALPDVKVIRYARFRDHRGYFTEHYRRSDFAGGDMTAFMRGIEFVQTNESFSRRGTLRGLHFQWNPYQGKLVRTLHGHMIDLALDIRHGSPTFGRIVAYDMPMDPNREYGDWIWLPPGFAHGTVFLQDSTIEYFCSGEYNATCEAGISPLAADIDWSLCDVGLKGAFDRIAWDAPLLSEKDRAGLSVSDWARDDRSALFTYPSGVAI